MGLSNTPADWSDYYQRCEKHNEKFHASEGNCTFCDQEAVVLGCAGACPECGEEFFSVEGEKGGWYLECDACSHKSAKAFYMEDLEGEEWPDAVLGIDMGTGCIGSATGVTMGSIDENGHLYVSCVHSVVTK